MVAFRPSARPPRPLGPGARVGVFAPSGAFDGGRLERGLELVRAWGFHPVLAPGLAAGGAASLAYLAADDPARLADATWALTHPDLDAAWMVRGGYGLTRLFEHLPWAEVDDRPVVGFSDGTVLHVGLWQRSRRSGVHGPVLTSLADTDPEDLACLRALLSGRPGGPWPGRALVPGAARGPLVGGNLCMLASTCGTTAQLDARGSVLFLEEVGEAPYRLDRMLTQLRGAGVFDGVEAVVVGQLEGTRWPDDAATTADALLRDRLGPLGVPVVVDAPMGHGRRNRAFLVGSPVRVDAEGVTADGPWT